jgi:hypothetical protein
LAPQVRLPFVQLQQYFFWWFCMCVLYFLAIWFYVFFHSDGSCLSYSALWLPVVFLCVKIYKICFMQCRHLVNIKLRMIIIRSV